MTSDGWIYATAGDWRFCANVKMGGSRFDCCIPGIGWVVATAGPPSKHVARHLVHKIHRTMRRMGISHLCVR